MFRSSRVFSTFSCRVNWQRYTRQILSMALMLSLAFPQTVWADTFSTQNIIGFNVFAAQIKAAVKGNADLLDPLEQPEPVIEKYKDRDSKELLSAKVTTLKTEIPDKLEMYSRQKISLPFIPTDKKGNAVHGLKVDAESSNTKVAIVTKDGFIIAGNPGIATITAKAGAQTYAIAVTVIPQLKVKQDAPPPKIGLNNGGSGRAEKNSQWNAKEKVATRFAPNSSLLIKTKSLAAFQYGPPPSYQTTRIYDTGRPALRTENGAATPAAATGGTERPGSANFNFSVPLVNLQGRGPGVGVGLNYNSSV